MMKILLALLLLCISGAITAQSKLLFRADTVRIYKQGGTAELLLENSTKDTTGIATNVGRGLIRFMKSRKIDDSTLVIGVDTVQVGNSAATGLNASQVQSLIDDAIALIPLNFNSTIEGDGNIGNEYGVNTSVFVTQAGIDSLTLRIDSIVINWPGTGTGGGKTTIQNVGSGDTLAVKVNDSLWSVKSLIAGTNITFTVDGDDITINGASGTAEVNTYSLTLGTTGNQSVASGNMIQYVLVKPASNLAGFKIGTLSDDDYYFPATPVVATAEYVVFDVGAYIPSTTAIYFSGITSSTELKVVTKPLHE